MAKVGGAVVEKPTFTTGIGENNNCNFGVAENGELHSLLEKTVLALRERDLAVALIWYASDSNFLSSHGGTVIDVAQRCLGGDSTCLDGPQRRGGEADGRWLGSKGGRKYGAGDDTVRGEAKEVLNEGEDKARNSSREK